LKNNNISKIFDLKNKTIILTGSAGRLGSRFAHVLSNAQANVILVDIEQTKNKQLEKKINSIYNTNSLSVNTDITKEDQVKKLIDIVIKKYKKIDGLINNAHILLRDHSQRDASFENYPLDLWEKMTSENLRAAFLCSREVGKIMVKQKHGVILNISSIYGIMGADQRIYGKSRLNSPPTYAMTKGGMVNFTRYLAAYWQGKNIRVNTLTLGGVYDKKLHQDKSFVKKYSEKTILGRMAEKSDFDGALLFLVSDASSYVTGTNLIVDGGWSVW
jgi:NAD(P)-dependent dehydrogenase (short-subunit alcohol dehydrogenase family)